MIYEYLTLKHYGDCGSHYLWAEKHPDFEDGQSWKELEDALNHYGKLGYRVRVVMEGKVYLERVIEEE